MAMWFETKGKNIPFFLKDKGEEHESNMLWNLVVLMTISKKM